MAYEIEFISDTRFDGTKEKLIQYDKQLKETGVGILSEGEIRELNWSAENYEGAKPSKQWRKKYIIGKGKFKTYGEVFGAVNKIYPPYYKYKKFF